jgi:hypothetical protein
MKNWQMKRGVCMTIGELADISYVKDETVKKNIRNVPGAYQDDDGEWIIPNGSRYPFDAHRYKFNDVGKRRLALLDATYQYRYVNYDKLHMSEESFITMIEELRNAGYLMFNNSNNHYGANQYDTTMKYEQLKGHSKRYMLKKIADTIASMACQLAVAYVSKQV